MKGSIGWIGAMGLALAVGATGCPKTTTGGGGRRRAKEPSRSDLEGIELRDMSVDTPKGAATRYGASVEHALGESEQAVVDALGGLPVTHLPALSLMTRVLAQEAPDQNTMPPSLVDGLMAWSGLPDPQPRLVVVELPEDSRQCHVRIGPGCEAAVSSLVEQVKMTLPPTEPLLFGVGVVSLASGTTRMMVSVLERGVELDSIPVAVDRRGSVPLTGRLLGGRIKPRVDVVGPGGDWSSLDVSLSVDGRFSTRVACSDGAGAYQVEVFGDGTHGPEVVANFPIYCGVDPPKSISIQIEVLDPSVTAEQIARANFLYLNEERSGRGLPPLTWAPEAASVARAHCVDMIEHDFVGHRSPTTGEVMDRFVAAGIPGVVVRENVARGYGPKGIHESLMDSPGHRVNILATDVTHVGIGVVVSEPETDVPGAPRPVFATQNFYRKPGAGAPEAVADLAPALRARVDELRGEQGQPPIGWSDGLSAIAQRRAEALGRGRPPPKGFENEVYALGYVAVASHRLSSVDFEALAGAELWTGPLPEVGIGVVRSKERGGEEMFLTVVLVAERE